MFSARQTWIPVAAVDYLPIIVTANVLRTSPGGTANTMRIQIYNGTPNIDWGDGNFTVVSTPGTYSKTYANNSTLKQITLNSPNANVGFKFTDANRVVDVTDFGTIPITNAQGMFANSRGLTTLTTTRTPNFEGNTDASLMFSNANAFSHNVSNWNITNVSNTSLMFRGASVFNIDIGGWDMKNVKDVSGMFQLAVAFNQPIGSWNMSNVTNTANMFVSARAFNQNIGSWDMGNVTNTGSMFAGANVFNNGGSDTIKNWNISNVTNAALMFQNTTAFDQPVGSWSPVKLQNASLMFNGSGFNNGGNSSFAGWSVTSNLTTTSGMFQNASLFNQPVGEINMSNVTITQSMFYNAYAFNNGGNTNINNWNTANITNMATMFLGANSFNQNIGNWNVSNVISMGVMFSTATAFNNGGSSDINNWNTANLNNCYAMFRTASSFNQPLGNWDTSKMYVFVGEGSSLDYMFYEASVYNQDLSTWCVANFASYTPVGFDGLTPSWALPKPVWGTCPP